MANALISKIKLANGTYVDLKDAEARAKLVTLLGGEENYKNLSDALGAAAWKAVVTEVKADVADLPTAAAVKAYVDAQVGAIHNFDIVIDKDGSAATGPSIAASANTMYKIYMVPSDEAAAGSYIEYITVKNADNTYAWEAIGNTKVSLSGYVPTTTTVATIALDHNITVDELKNALGLKALAYKDDATGSTTLATIDSISMKDLTVAGNATVTHTDTAATVNKVAYTPAGEVTIGGTASSDTNKVLTGGSIAVTLKDTSTNATIAAEAYTPAGSVTLAKDASGSFQVSGQNSSSAVTFTGGSTASVLGSVKNEAVLPSFTDNKIGNFTAASLGANFYTAGSAATYSHTGFSGGSLGAATKKAVASEGLVASVGSGDDAETLIFAAADTQEVVSEQGTFTAAEYGNDSFNGGTPTAIDVSAFNGGSWTQGTFNAGSVATFNNATVIDNIGTGTAAAQTFTGDKFAPAFAGTEAADMKVTGVTYNKPAVESATFSGTSAALGFSGTKLDNALVDSVTYAKADATAAFSETVAPEIASYNKTDKTIEITVK